MGYHIYKKQHESPYDLCRMAIMESSSYRDHRCHDWSNYDSSLLNDHLPLPAKIEEQIEQKIQNNNFKSVGRDASHNLPPRNPGKTRPRRLDTAGSSSMMMAKVKDTAPVGAP
jgi:hypothetical protein